MRLSYKKISKQAETFNEITAYTPGNFECEVVPLIVREYNNLKLAKLHHVQGKSVSDLTAIYAKSAPALDSRKRLRTKLIDSLLMYFLYRNCKVTQNCLAQLFGFSHRSTVRRRLRTVVVIFELIRESRDKRRRYSGSLQNIYWKFIGEASGAAAERKLMERVRRTRANVPRRTVRTPEEFFVLYPQLFEGKAVKKMFLHEGMAKLPEACPITERKNQKIVREKSAINSAESKTRLCLPPKLKPKCYKNSRTALDFIIAKRWNGQIICPLCGADKVYLLQSNTRTKKSSTGSIRIKCAACRRQFSAISNTALAGCRLKPDQILRAVYYVSFRPRRTSYTIEKYAAEVGITSKSAKRFLTILTQNCSTSAIKNYYTVPPFTGQSGNSIPVHKKTKENFLALRNSLPGDGDQLINYLLKTRR